MADEAKKDTRTRDLPMEEVTAPVPNAPSEEDTSDDKPYTGRQRKYDGGDIPRRSQKK